MFENSLSNGLCALYQFLLYRSATRCRRKLTNFDLVVKGSYPLEVELLSLGGTGLGESVYLGHEVLRVVAGQHFEKEAPLAARRYLDVDGIGSALTRINITSETQTGKPQSLTFFWSLIKSDEQRKLPYFPKRNVYSAYHYVKILIKEIMR